MIWFDLLLFHKYLDKYEFQKKRFYYHFTQDLLKELKKHNLNRATLLLAIHKKTILET